MILICILGIITVILIGIAVWCSAWGMNKIGITCCCASLVLCFILGDAIDKH